MSLAWCQCSCPCGGSEPEAHRNCHLKACPLPVSPSQVPGAMPGKRPRPRAPQAATASSSSATPAPLPAASLVPWKPPPMQSSLSRKNAAHHHHRVPPIPWSRHPHPAACPHSCLMMILPPQRQHLRGDASTPVTDGGDAASLQCRCKMCSPGSPCASVGRPQNA